MIAALLLAAAAPTAVAPATAGSIPEEAPPRNAIEAEHAFARDAQWLGQWTAFRKWAGFAGVMFVPRAVNAWQWLRDKTDPPQSVKWQPAVSYESCDGKTAINVGPWTRPDGSFGYFTTVWFLEEELKDGPRWIWAYDAGDTLKSPMAAPAAPTIRRASCDSIPPRAPGEFRYSIPSAPSPDSPEAQQAQLSSRDRSLLYDYAVDESGARTFRASLWDGRQYVEVVAQSVAAPKP